MRPFGLLILASAVALTGLNFVGSQQPFGGRTFQGGFQNDPLSLLRNPSVKKELDLSDEQMEKLPEAVRKALREVLTEKQSQRLRQIQLQQQGAAALKDASVQSELQLTEAQKKNLDTVFEESAKSMAELRKDGKGFGRETFEKIESIRNETKERAMGILNPNQKKAYRNLIGDEFKMERPTFPGFGKKGNES